MCPAIWVKLVVPSISGTLLGEIAPIPWGRSELIILRREGGELVGGGGGDAKFYPHPSGVYRQL